MGSPTLPETDFDGFPDVRSDFVDGLGGIDDDETVRLAAGEVQIALADGFIEGAGLRFHAVGSVANSRGQAGGGNGRVEVEEEGDGGQAITDGKTVDNSNFQGIDAAGNALIDGSGVVEAVADDDAASVQSRKDFFPDELGAAGGEEEEFGFGGEECPVFGILQQVANGFAGVGAARLASDEWRGAHFRQALGEELDLSGFAAGFGALESDKQAVGHEPSMKKESFRLVHANPTGNAAIR